MTQTFIAFRLFLLVKNSSENLGRFNCFKNQSRQFHATVINITSLTSTPLHAFTLFCFLSSSHCHQPCNASSTIFEGQLFYIEAKSTFQIIYKKYMYLPSPPVHLNWAIILVLTKILLYLVFLCLLCFFSLSFHV